jgi:hypothetical protein
MKRYAGTLIPLLLMVVLMWPLRFGFTDDGFIHIQYARNLMLHGEYSFNPGEVSFGTTSPLWVLLLAAIGHLGAGVSGLIDASRVLSWLGAFATVLLVQRALVACGASRRTALLGSIAFAVDAWFVRWSALGMESSLAACAAVLALVASLRGFETPARAARFGVAAAIGALIRPEMYLMLPVWVVAAFAVRPRPRISVVVAGLGAAAALLLPWRGFAKWHIGSFLPNTAGAKSGGMVTSPVQFVMSFSPILKILLSTQAVAMAALLLDLLVSRRDAVALRPQLRFAVLWIVALPVAYVAVDMQVLSRYLLVMSPFIAVAGWRALENLLAHPSWSRARARGIAFAAVGLSVMINTGFYYKVVLPPSIAFSRDLQTNMTKLAQYLHDNSMPDVVVAAADIGYLAFYSERRVLDLGGLVEPRTAVLREQFDYEVIVDEGLYFDIEGYPHVDYLVDRVHEANRLDGQVINGHRFEPVYATEVANLGIRKPGVFHYTLYRIIPVDRP